MAGGGLAEQGVSSVQVVQWLRWKLVGLLRWGGVRLFHVAGQSAAKYV